MAPMSRVLIVYHSHTGNTEAMAKAIYDGAVAAGATVSLKKAADAIFIDSTHCSVKEVVEEMVRIIEEKIESDE
jgi:flavodoxin